MTMYTPQGTSAAVHLYDMTLTYLTLLNDTLSRGQDPRDGQLYLDKARNLHLQGNVLKELIHVWEIYDPMLLYFLYQP